MHTHNISSITVMSTYLTRTSTFATGHTPYAALMIVKTTASMGRENRNTECTARSLAVQFAARNGISQRPPLHLPGRPAKPRVSITNAGCSRGSTICLLCTAMADEPRILLRRFQRTTDTHRMHLRRGNENGNQKGRQKGENYDNDKPAYFSPM